MLICVELGSNLAIGVFAGDVPVKGQTNGSTLEGMEDQSLAIPLIGTAKIRAVIQTVGIGTARAKAVTVA